MQLIKARNHHIKFYLMNKLKDSQVYSIIYIYKKTRTKKCRYNSIKEQQSYENERYSCETFLHCSSMSELFLLQFRLLFVLLDTPWEVYIFNNYLLIIFHLLSRYRLQNKVMPRLPMMFQTELQSSF